MKLAFISLIFLVQLIFCLSVDDSEYYDYDYTDDNDEFYRQKWFNLRKNHGRRVSVKMYLDANSNDLQERYFIYKDNIKSIEDHNQAFKQGLVTFSLKDNHFTHLTYDEFHDYVLTPLRMNATTVIRAGTSKNGTLKAQQHANFKPVRAMRHQKKSNKTRARRNSDDDYEENEIDAEEHHNHTHLVFHHVNKFDKNKYSRVATKFRKDIEINNGGIFTLKAKSNIITVVDWNARGFVSPVPDQGSCGSCYAYAVAGAIESLIAIRKKSKRALRELSKQQILDCANDGDINAGCAGGNIYGTYEYIKKNGLQGEITYPYSSKYWEEDETKGLIGYSAKCKLNPKRIIVKTIGEIKNIKTGDVQTMQDVLKNQTISAYIFVVDDLFQYSKGIYSNDNCSADCSAPNHAVIITGYGSENGVNFWIVKNSWGSKWGEKGFFRIEAGVNMCCIESYNSYATL